jgi:hypothetical protein
MPSQASSQLTLTEPRGRQLSRAPACNANGQPGKSAADVTAGPRLRALGMADGRALDDRNALAVIYHRK